MSNAITTGAIVYAKDIKRVSRFYSHVTGLSVTREESGYVTLESPTFQLVVVGLPAELAAQITIATPPVRRENTAIKLCFVLASISAARATAAEFGGGLNGPEREWDFQGSRVCDGHDPEGNVIQVRAGAA